MQIELPGMPQRVEAAATKPQVASRGEIGYAQATLSQWWLFDEGETTPELQWPRSVAVYDQMRRTDAQVTSLLEAVSLPIRRTPWRIDPNGARATVVKFVATDMGLPIVGKGPGKAPVRTKGKFSWPDHLRLALLSLPFGHMFFEQVYSVNDAGTEAHLKKLAPRMPSTIDEIKVAADGGLEWIKQRWTSENGSPQRIPVDRLVAYVRNREGGNWLGQSILRPAYKNWLLKDRLLRVQAQTIERNGMGIPLYKAQEGASPGDMAAGKSMATLWRAGEAAGSAVPFGADLVLRGVEGTLPDADPAIRYHDEQIARAALAHFLNLGTQTGSWALGSTFADFFVYSLQTLAMQIADVTTQHVIEDLVDLNFGEDEPAPRLVFDEIGSQQAATAQALKTLVDAGIIHPDQVLEETSRQQYGLPPADPATATPPPGQTAPTPPEATPMGAESVAAARPARRRPRRGVTAKYNPAQKRDPNGEWGDGIPGPGLPDFTDGLGIDDVVPLDPGDRLGSSDRLSDEDELADLNWVVVFSKEYGPEVRLGVTPADESNDWKGDWEDGSDTAILDTDTVTKLRTRLESGVEQAKQAARDADKAWNSGQAPTDPKLLGSEPVASGEAIGGGDTADLTWGIFLTDDDPASWNLEVRTNPDSDGVRYDPKGARRLLKELARIEGELRGPQPPETVSAAAGVDTHPGGEELKHYWVYGEGAAKWKTFTELLGHLRKYLAEGMAKRTAAAWFHLRWGYWPGDHRNVHASADVDDEAAEREELIEALILALAELHGEVRAAAGPDFDEKHPRGAGGKFRSTVDKLKSAIETHRAGGGKGDPFADFDREQLRRAASKRPGITLTRGESRDSIAKKLIDDLGGKAATPAPAPAAPRKRTPSAKPARAERLAKVRDVLGKEGYEDFDVLSALSGLEKSDLRQLTAAEREEIGRELRSMAETAEPDDRKTAELLRDKLGFNTAPTARKRTPRKAAPPAVAEPGRSARGRLAAGRDIVDDIIRDVNGGDPRHGRLQVAYGLDDPRDGILTQLTRDQGYGLPEVGSVDDAVKGGGVELFRGVRSHESGISAEAQIAAMRDDPDFAYGNGYYGNGIYFSVDKRVADRFGRSSRSDTADPDAESFGDGATVRVALRPGAKTITMRKLEAERKQWLKANRDRLPPDVEDWVYDNGRYATMRGYDVIQVDNMDDGYTIHEGGRKRQSKARQYIVLNRGAITMEAG